MIAWKKTGYLALVSKMKKRYEIPKINGKITLAGLGNRCGGCQEINLYTYWQGLGYAKSTPPIKYLLVGQDWGSMNYIGVEFEKRIEKLNQDKKRNINCDEPYIIRGSKENFPTDENLIDLFSVLGYDGKQKESIDKKRHEELFFTNFCLGYREKKSSGNMDKNLLKLDADIFISLCEILEPENILCLGKITFQCVYESLTNGEVCNLDNFDGGYNKFIVNHSNITAKCGNRNTKIYPLAHCGNIGTMNRNRGSGKTGLENQIEDWHKIAKENQ